MVLSGLNEKMCVKCLALWYIENNVTDFHKKDAEVLQEFREAWDLFFFLFGKGKDYGRLSKWLRSHKANLLICQRIHTELLPGGWPSYPMR